MGHLAGACGKALNLAGLIPNREIPRHPDGRITPDLTTDMTDDWRLT
jgi:hypothetical protein